MTKKIFRSIFFAAVVVLISGFILIMGVLYNYFGSVQENQLKTELNLAAECVEAGGISYLEKTGENDCRLTYIAKDGTVLYDSWSDAAEMENHGEREEVKEALKTGEGKSYRYSVTLTEKTIYYAKRLSDGTVLRVSVNRMTVPALLLGMLQPILIVLVIALSLSFALAARMAKKILEPLNALNLDHPLKNDVYDELSPLFTRMEQQLRQIRYQKGELADMKKEFYAVIENMKEGLVLLSQEDKIISINPAAIAFFQVEDVSAGTALSDFSLPGDALTGRDFLTIERDYEINRTLRRAKTEGHSELVVNRGGREYQMNVSRIEEKEQASGVVIFIFDITEKVFAERNRREFSANVSHELKTPLHSIMGSAELMENGLVREEDVPVFMRRIRSEAERLVALIEDIIRLSQLDEEVEMSVEEVDLYELAKEETESLRPASERKKITVTVEGERTVMQGVRQLLHEIVYNLCDNAVKYNVEKGNVTVTVGREGEEVFLIVADTGIGIPEEDQERIFERFYRVDKSRSKESGGTGLGLSIVKHAVQYMDGKICLKSKIGGGTAVKVSFPQK